MCEAVSIYAIDERPVYTVFSGELASQQLGSAAAAFFCLAPDEFPSCHTRHSFQGWPGREDGTELRDIGLRKELVAQATALPSPFYSSSLSQEEWKKMNQTDSGDQLLSPHNSWCDFPNTVQSSRPHCKAVSSGKSSTLNSQAQLPISAQLSIQQPLNPACNGERQVSMHPLCK